MLEMADILREQYPQYPLPSKALPKFLVYLVGPFVASFSWHYIRHNVNVPHEFSVEKAKKELNFEFRPVKQGVFVRFVGTCDARRSLGRAHLLLSPLQT